MFKVSIVSLSLLAAAAHGAPIGSVIPVRNGECLATRIADGWAITTTSCAQGRPNVVHVDSKLSLLPAGPGDIAALDANDFRTSGWSDGSVAILSRLSGAVNTVPVAPANPFSTPASSGGYVSIVPNWANCSVIDGAPVFVDDTPTGAPSFLEVPLVAIVDANVSTCSLLSVRPLAPLLRRIRSLLPVQQEPETVWIYVPHPYAESEGTWFGWLILILVLSTLTAYMCWCDCGQDPLPVVEDYEEATLPERDAFIGSANVLPQPSRPRNNRKRLSL